MKLILKQKWKDTDLVFDGGEVNILVDYLGISFVNKKTGEVEDRITDFLGASMGIITRDRNHLFLSNTRSLYRSYDLKARKMVAELDLSMDPSSTPFGIEESMDGKSLYFVMAEDARAMLQGIEGKGKTEIHRFSFPDLKEIEALPSEENYYDIAASSFLNGYLMVNMKGHIDFMDANGNVRNYPSIAIADTSPVVNEKRKEFYIPTEYGFRIFDAEFREINKFDLISDDKKQVKSPMYYFMKNDIESALSSSGAEQMENAEEIERIRLIDENHLLVLISEAMGSYYRIEVCDVRDGSLSESIKCGFKIIDADVYDEKHITFFARSATHLLEIVE